MKQTILPAMFFLLIAPLSAMSHASLTSPQFSQHVQIAQNGSHNLASVVRSIKKRTGGRILSTKTVTRNGHRIYKIKVLLPSGKVRTFKVSAQ